MKKFVESLAPREAGVRTLKRVLELVLPSSRIRGERGTKGGKNVKTTLVRAETCLSARGRLRVRVTTTYACRTVHERINGASRELDIYQAGTHAHAHGPVSRVCVPRSRLRNATYVHTVDTERDSPRLCAQMRYLRGAPRISRATERWDLHVWKSRGEIEDVEQQTDRLSGIT